MNVPAEISNRAAECLQLLETWRREAASRLPPAENAVFLFRLWATNNFVFTNDRMCLDWRLRNVAVLASVIRDLLDSFKSTLSDILETANHPGLPQDADNDHVTHNLAQIDDFQTRLFDICRAIHRSGVLSRLSKVANYRELLEFDGKVIDLSEHFRASIEIIVEKRHPKASKSTRLRLFDSISLRRQNFNYLRDRELKASEALGQRMSAFGSEGVSSLLTSRPAEASATSSPADVLKLNSKRRRLGAGQTSTIFTASTANAQRVFKTQSVRTSSTFLESKYHAIDGMMPRPPKPMDDSGYIKCPYCFLVCSTNELQGKFWKRHFIQDLMPYVCLLDGCSMPDTLFESFGEWTAHMANQHSTTIWTCTNRSHGSPSRFYSRTDFEAHLRDDHEDEFEEGDLEELVESSAVSRPRREPLTDCPLCIDDFDAKSMPLNDILNHVAEHMISLALLSLPEDECREPANSESLASNKSSTIQTRVSAVSTIAKAMETGLSVDADEMEIEDEELSADLIEIPELPPTEENQWNQFWDGNPLPICTTPEASLLKAFEYHPGPETSAETSREYGSDQLGDREDGNYRATNVEDPDFDAYNEEDPMTEEAKTSSSTQPGESASAGPDESESHPGDDPRTSASAPVPTTSNDSDGIDIDSILDRLLEVRGSRPGKQVHLLEMEIRYLCTESRNIFISQPILLELEAPMTICGDIHGQYYDLLRSFEYRGFPPEANFLFLGNYVDYGKQSLEVICLLLAYKIKYPENFFLLRGNHECASETRINGFYDECKRRYNIKLWKIFTDCFNCLPLAAIIDEKIFCMHGGLSPDLNSMEQIRRIMRPTDIPDCGLAYDLLCSDPDKDVTGWTENDTHEGTFAFGPDVVSRFLAKHDMDLIVRSSQVVEDGYEFFANRHLITIFGAPNFRGEFDNAGAMMSVDENLLCSFQILKPAEKRPRFGRGPVAMSSNQDTDVAMSLDTAKPGGNPSQDLGTVLDSKISDPVVESSSASRTGHDGRNVS